MSPKGLTWEYLVLYCNTNNFEIPASLVQCTINNSTLQLWLRTWKDYHPKSDSIVWENSWLSRCSYGLVTDVWSVKERHWNKKYFALPHSSLHTVSAQSTQVRLFRVFVNLLRKLQDICPQIKINVKVRVRFVLQRFLCYQSICMCFYKTFVVLTSKKLAKYSFEHFLSAKNKSAM